MPGVSARRSDDPTRIGPYDIVGVLGEGGMARVHLRGQRGRPAGRGEGHARGRPPRPGVPRTIPPGDRGRPPGQLELHRRDRRRDLDADPPWYAAEYVRAPSLAGLVDLTGPLPVPAVRWLAAGVAGALLAVHARRIVHRDLKPANVLVELAGPQLIEFGIARSRGEEGLTAPGRFIGTLAYMAPEQIDGIATPASDVYALGATLVHAATGHPPFSAADDNVLAARVLAGRIDREGLPAELADLVDRCTHRDPQQRPAPADLLRTLAGELHGCTGPDLLPPQVVAAISEFARDDEQETDRQVRAQLGRARAPQHRTRRLTRAPLLPRWHLPLRGVTRIVADVDTVVARCRDEVVAVAAADGTVRWRQRAPATGCARLGMGAGVVCFVAGTELCCVDAHDGRRRWRAPLPSADLTDLSLAELFVCHEGMYVRLPDRIRRFDRVTGERRRTLRGTVQGPLTIVDDRIYGRSSSSCYAFDISTGEFLWRTPADRRVGGHHGRVAASGPTVAVLTERRTGPTSTSDLVGLDRHHGRRRWSTTCAGNVLSAAAGHGFVTSGATSHEVVDAGSGAVFAVDSRVGSAPAPAPAAPLLTTADGDRLCAWVCDEVVDRSAR